MTQRERDELIEQVVGAWRPVDPDGTIRSHPAWHDLPEVDRAEAFERQRLSRKLEAALDPEGLSTTARGVLERILPARL